MENKQQILEPKAFEDYLDFWAKHMVFGSPKKIYPEISIDNTPNKSALMGSMYLSRILYGASVGCKTLETTKFRTLAETSFESLMEFKNPMGGYFWGRKYNMEWIHDPENVNMAQAFVLYGLVEYAGLNPSEELDQLIEEQLEFILSVLTEDGGLSFLDGYDEHWQAGQHMTRSFGSHFHIMEAFVKFYEYRNDADIKKIIAGLIRTIIDKFIDKEKYICIHRFGANWEDLPNEIWAGHNAECSWILCEASKAINDSGLIEETHNLAILMMEGVITFGQDKNKGGYFNVLDSDPSIDKTKGWWQQAEVTLGLLNAYAITGQKRYKKLALEQVSYIQAKFLCPQGDWYEAVTNEGTPVEGVPKASFWKCIYHTGRFYDYLIRKVNVY